MNDKQMRLKATAPNAAMTLPFQIEHDGRGIGESRRSAVAFSQVSMHHLFPIFYPTSFTALPGIGAAPTESIQSVRNDLTNAVGTRKDVR